MPFPFRTACASMLLALAISTAHAQPVAAPAAPPSVEAFFASAKFGGATLSPSGKYIAARAGAEGQRDMLMVVDLTTNTGKVVAAYNDADIDTFRWVNDERLVFNVQDKDLGTGDKYYAPGLFAVNRDGSNLVQLADRFRGAQSLGRKILPFYTYLFEQPGPRNSEWVYVFQPEWAETGKLSHISLMRLNTVTGQTEMVPRPAKVQGWMLDEKGEPRLATGTDKNLTTIYYRDPANNEWRKLASFDPYKQDTDKILPVGFGPDGTLYVTAQAGKDTRSLYTFNFKTGSINPDPVIVTAGYDFNGKLITSKDKVLGLDFTTDARSQEWLDPGMKALQQEVDKALPATVNLLLSTPKKEAPWVLVVGYSDVIPPAYWLYNKDTRQVSKVGDSHPAINPRQMGHQEPIRYKARDGLDIPALLTLPPGGKSNLPLVVLVHGGPWVNGTAWGWNPISQFLASRGYAVLEPSFRGTTGLGSRHMLSSFKQWGLAMQNDVADGTRYLIGKGIADPKRICIAGASYGGYATLMGLVNDPDLYKCGVNWVGVTDINLMYKGSWNYRSDMTDEWKQYGMPDMIGDPVKDAAQLKATSPIEQASRITQPVLMAYGGVDERVPMYHGKQFYDAVTRTNKNVEWIEYPDEGHGWHLPKNNYDFWTRVEKFLDKNIGPGSQKQQ